MGEESDQWSLMSKLSRTRTAAPASRFSPCPSCGTRRRRPWRWSTSARLGLGQAQDTFEVALEPIRVVAGSVLEKLAGLARSPDEVHVEFGLELTAKAGAIVAAVGSTAQLTVGLTWRGSSEATVDDETPRAVVAER